MTHLLKLLDKVCKYEMDPASIVEDTEWTRFCPQMDGQMDKWTRWNQYTPFQVMASAKPLPPAILDFSLVRFCCVHLKEISQWVAKLSCILNMYICISIMEIKL